MGPGCPQLLKLRLMIKPAILIILFIVLNFSLKAQSWELGASVGGAGYMGELNESNPVSISGVAFGAFVQKNLNGYFSLKLNYNYGKIGATDANSNNPQMRARNLSFNTTLNEFSVIGELNFFNYIPQLSKSKISPYILLGVAVANYVPTTVYNGKVYDLRQATTEGQTAPYSTVALSVPFGAGVKYNITGAWTLSADIGYRATNTGYLDDVSGYYPNLPSNVAPITKILSDRSGEKTGVYIGTPGTQRGDLNTHDIYYFAQVSISFTFLSQKCFFER